MMEVIEVIRKRRSIRRFTDRKITRETLMEILEAARWAPSGLNNQPWRFAIVKEGKKERLATLTRYSNIIKAADTCIAVFLDPASSYDRTKDLLAIGASIQNMLLSAYSIGVGTCWLGEILKRKDDVNILLGIPSEMELVAVIGLGYPDESPESSRKEISSILIDLN